MKNKFIYVLFLFSASVLSAEVVAPLNSAQLSKLGHDFHNSSQDEFVELERSMLGTKIRVQVKAIKRKDGSYWGQIIHPKREHQPGPWLIHMMNFREDFFGKMEDQAKYTIEGVIVEDRMDYGAFWAYINKFEKVEQVGTGQPATRPESKSEGGDQPQPEAERRSQ